MSQHRLDTHTKSKGVGLQFGESLVLFVGLTLNEFLFGIRWVDNAFILHFGIFELGATW
jgi:hypothetical protein